jgi:putative ABC transport system substrate-binding protein
MYVPAQVQAQSKHSHEVKAMRREGEMNKRKLGSFALSVMLLALCASAEAQQPKKVARIGYVSGTGDSSNPGPYVAALRQGLRDLGYIEGKNIVIKYRGAEGKLERIPVIVAEHVQLKVDVLVVLIPQAIRAAKQATKTIPIVMVTQEDPVAAGLIDSLARPGGNITGLATLQRDLSGKRLELLAEVVPGISRVGVLDDASTDILVGLSISLNKPQFWQCHV